MVQLKLGVDIGGVIIGAHRADEEFPEIEGALMALTRFNKDEESPFKNNVFLVSRANPQQQVNSLGWLCKKGFYQKTGISFDKIFFCPERVGKAGICVKNAITHFVDDRLEVLCYLHTVSITNLFLFQGRPDEIADYEHGLKFVRQMERWSALEALYF